MIILITGAHGFVGTNLSLYLKNKGYSIWALTSSKKTSGIYEKSFLWSELELIPKNEIDIVIHLAGKAHDTKNRTEAQKYFDINLGLTKKIYDWFLISSAKKFIFFSSVKAAADKVLGNALNENVLPSPKGPYGESKIEAEKYIIEKSKISDKQYYIIRPCMIHGKGNKGNLNLLYSVVKKGIPYPLGVFENKRTFTSIDNLCFTISKLFELDVKSGIYNICDDESLSTNELISIISSTLGKRSRIWKLNKNFIYLFAKIGTILHLPLNTERLQKLTENYVVSNSKIKAAIGIEKMPITANEGLVKTIKSFKTFK